MLNKQFAEAIRPKILFSRLRIKSVKQPLFLTVNSFKLKSSFTFLDHLKPLNCESLRQRSEKQRRAPYLKIKADSPQFLLTPGQKVNVNARQLKRGLLKPPLVVFGRKREIHLVLGRSCEGVLTFLAQKSKIDAHHNEKMIRL